MNTISRRTALTGAGVALIATTAVPLVAHAAQAGQPANGLNDNVLLALEQQWLAFREHIYADHPDESDEAIDLLYDRWQEMEEVIYCNPAKTPGGVVVKLRIWTLCRTSLADDCPYGESRWRGALAPMPVDKWGMALIIRDLERLSGGPQL